MRGFQGGSAVKNPPVMQEYQETQVRSLGWEDPLRRAWQHTPVFLPGESYWQRSLEGYSPWVAKSQTWLSVWTELIMTLTLLKIGD